MTNKGNTTMTKFNTSALAVQIAEQITHPALIDNSKAEHGTIGGTVVESFDAIQFFELTQETERVARAATVLRAAQLLSNGTSAREIARMRGINASSFSRDRLWAQLAPLAGAITSAREAGERTLTTIEIQVPVSRSEMRAYTFHDVPTGL